MKQSIYMIGIAAVIAASAGAVFKVNHFPGAGILIVTGIAILVFAFLPAALINHYRAGERKGPLLHIVTYITALLVFTAMLFKLMHWPGAGYLLFIALPLPYLLFLPVFLYVTSGDRNFSIYNTVFVLILLALNSVFSGLLALNVTSLKIKDSYMLASNYNRQEATLGKAVSFSSASEINMRIDEVLRDVNECQEMLLRMDGKTRVGWTNNPGNIERPDFRGSAARSMTEDDFRKAAKLYSGLKDLMAIMASSPVYKLSAERAWNIFLMDSSLTEEEWIAMIFNDFLSWTLIYLDSLQSGLMSLKEF